MTEPTQHWKHRSGDLYFAFCSYPQGNPEAGYRFEQWRIGEGRTHPSLNAAWIDGCRAIDSDDFNIGVMRGGVLVASLWGPDGEIVDDGAGVVATYSEGLGLR